MKRFARMVAALAVGVGIVTGANGLLGTVTASAGTFGTIQGDSGNEAESAADIIEEMKNGDRSRTKKLAEAYRYGRGVEKSMLNAMICYQIAEVDFDSEAKKSYEENPNDEFGRLIRFMNMYDRHYLEDAEELLSGIPEPVPAWVTMMRKIMCYQGEDINGYVLSMIGPDSTPDECFMAFGCYISNNKESNDFRPLNELMKVLSYKVPFFYNKTGELKLEEFKGSQDVKLLKEAVMEFKKANDAGFLSPRNARRIFEEDIRCNVDLASVFTSEELEQLGRLGASTSSEMDHAEVVEMTPEDEAVELIESVTIEEAFNLIATLEGFEKVDEAEVYELFNFPKEIGEPTMIVHGNAMHREEILWFMERLPEGSMIYDDTDEAGRFDRWFLNTDNNDLLYVHVGINGNDTVLVLFKNGNRGDIDSFLEELNRQ